MIFKKVLVAAVATLLSFGAQSAMATTTNECVPDAGGDFSNAFTISPDVPATGTGVRIFGCLDETDDLDDVFSFKALGFFQVNLEYLSNFGGDVGFKLYDADNTVRASATLSSSLPNIFDKTFSAGDYYLGLTLNVFGCGDDCPTASAEYTFQLKNAPAPPVVPLPAALPMLLAGLGGLGLVARRKKHKVA
jgi:hypothetical protein